MTWYSQAGQDQWVTEMMRANGRETGFFVDLGAYDGVQTSNTLALADLGWTGICVEANEEYFKRLAAARDEDSVCVWAAVAAEQKILHWMHQTATPDKTAPLVVALPLGRILEENGAPTVIDYLSMDIEGMELEVLGAYDFSHHINLLTVEHNLYCDGPRNKDALYSLLSNRGFLRIVEDAPCLDPAYHGLPYEDWYAHRDFR